MACAMMTYNNFTGSAFDSLKKAFAEYNVTISTDTGSATTHGFTVSWHYDRPSQHLHLQCTSSPFFVPCSAVNSHINDAVEACLRQHNIEVAHIVPPARG
jgi:hypothetical protein